MKISTTIVVPFMSASLALLILVLPVSAEHHDAAPSSEIPQAQKQEVPAQAHINPTKNALEEMQKLPKDEPLYMLNMIRYRNKAEYNDGSEFAAKNWTGAEAYTEYRRHAGAIVARLGGKSIYEGISQLTLIGPQDEQWDVIFIIYYPNVVALKALSEDPEYQKHAFHRSAGVANSRLIRMVPASQ